MDQNNAGAMEYEDSNHHRDEKTDAPHLQHHLPAHILLDL